MLIHNLCVCVGGEGGMVFYMFEPRQSKNIKHRLHLLSTVLLTITILHAFMVYNINTCTKRPICCRDDDAIVYNPTRCNDVWLYGFSLYLYLVESRQFSCYTVTIQSWIEYYTIVH